MHIGVKIAEYWMLKMNRTRWMIPSIQPSSLAGWLSLPGSSRIHCKKSMHRSCSGSNKIVHRCRCEAKIYLFSDFDVSLCCVSLHYLFFVFFPHSCTFIIAFSFSLLPSLIEIQSNVVSQLCACFVLLMRLLAAIQMALLLVAHL